MKAASILIGWIAGATLVTIAIAAWDLPGSAVPLVLGVIIWSLASGINNALRKERLESSSEEY